MQKDKECVCRLAELIPVWFRLAADLDVYLLYEFTGVTTPSGLEGVLEMVDFLVTQAIQRSGAFPERQERWINLIVDFQPEGIRLVYASAGICQVELASLAAQRAKTSIHQYPDSYDLTVVWTAGDDPEETGEDAPC